MWALKWAVLVYCLNLALCGATKDPLQSLPGDGGRQPNIIFVLSDDQDLHMESLSYMPHLKSTLLMRDYHSSVTIAR